MDAGSGDAPGPGGTTAIGFHTASGAVSASVSAGDVSSSRSSNPDAPRRDVDGSNGRLSIASVHCILAKSENRLSEAFLSVEHGGWGAPYARFMR